MEGQELTSPLLDGDMTIPYSNVWVEGDNPECDDRFAADVLSVYCRLIERCGVSMIFVRNVRVRWRSDTSRSCSR